MFGYLFSFQSTKVESNNIALMCLNRCENMLGMLNYRKFCLRATQVHAIAWQALTWWRCKWDMKRIQSWLPHELNSPCLPFKSILVSEGRSSEENSFLISTATATVSQFIGFSSKPLALLITVGRLYNINHFIDCTASELRFVTYLNPWELMQRITRNQFQNVYTYIERSKNALKKLLFFEVIQKTERNTQHLSIQSPNLNYF